MDAPPRMEIIPVPMGRDMVAGDDISRIIHESIAIHDGDILVIAQKIVSKAEGRTVRLDGVRPSLLAQGIAAQYKKDPHVVELVLQEASQIVRMGRGIIITRMPSGHICANSGVDTSNVPKGHALLLPADCDHSARRMAASLHERAGVKVGIIISDTVGRPFRNGQTDIALGCHGVAPLQDHTGNPDMYGRIMRVSVTAVADQLAGAAQIIMGKTSRVPVAILRNSGFARDSGNAGDMIRDGGELFV